MHLSQAWIKVLYLPQALYSGSSPARPAHSLSLGIPSGKQVGLRVKHPLIYFPISTPFHPTSLVAVFLALFTPH